MIIRSIARFLWGSWSCVSTRILCCCRTGDDESNVSNNVTKSSVTSAFSLPPSRAAQRPSNDDHQLPVAARSRDEGRSTKPRIWSLAEVATSVDYRPKRADHTVAAEFRHSAEFRPWSAAETASWKSTQAELGAWQATFVSAGNLSSPLSYTRCHRKDAANSVTTHFADWTLSSHPGYTLFSVTPLLLKISINNFTRSLVGNTRAQLFFLDRQCWSSQFEIAEYKNLVLTAVYIWHFGYAYKQNNTRGDESYRTTITACLPICVPVFSYIAT